MNNIGGMRGMKGENAANGWCYDPSFMIGRWRWKVAANQHPSSSSGNYVPDSLVANTLHTRPFHFAPNPIPFRRLHWPSLWPPSTFDHTFLACFINPLKCRSFSFFLSLKIHSRAKTNESLHLKKLKLIVI